MQRSTNTAGAAFSEAGAGAAWRQAFAGRAAYLAIPTARMFALAQLKPGARVLVVGGGTGDEAAGVARAIGPEGDVVMTDLSPSMVREARRALAEAGFPRVRCHVMDAQELKFAAATFDNVIARNVLMFIPDLPRGLSEMRRVLRPGGRLAATTWAAGDHNPRLSIPIAAAKTVGVEVPANAVFQRALSLSRPDRLAAALRRAGFLGVEVERASALARPADWDSFVADIHNNIGTRDIARLVPEKDRERFWRSLDRRFNGHRAAGELNGQQLVVAATA